ncbi:MAG: glycosyltransferase [Rubrivivax sp.]|nr:MAG: glycosyltransferase [Rubrivivax sp.]
MTQVVNGYLAWPFQHFTLGVIVSRGASSGWGAVKLFTSALWQVLRLKDRRREVVVVHLSQGGSFVREGVLLAMARWRGFGVVAHMHGSRFVAFAERWPRLVGSVLRRAHRVIVLSDATAAAVRRHVEAHRVVLVPNAVPEGVSAPKERLLVFGGSVSVRKGVDVLLGAWQQVLPEGWRLVIAGPFADIQPPNPPVPQVEFLGAVPHQALMGWLDRSAVAVLPSRDEAMPMFILEALARRNCVVSTRVGGIPGVLSGGRGELIEPGNVQALAGAIRRITSDDSQRQAMADAGHQSFKAEFSAEAVYPRIALVWQQAMDESDGGTPR